MLLHVMEQLNVPKKQTVLVGDSTNDINGGHNAGIRVCAAAMVWGIGRRWPLASGLVYERPEELLELFI